MVNKIIVFSILLISILCNFFNFILQYHFDGLDYLKFEPVTFVSIRLTESAIVDTAVKEQSLTRDYRKTLTLELILVALHK